MAEASRFVKSLRSPLQWLVVCVIFSIFILLGVISSDWGISPRYQPQNIAMQKSRAIELAMLAFANEHNGDIPSGKSSTEVFQKLLDEKYVSDASIFWNSVAQRKTEPKSTKLKPENVCYDITVPEQNASSDFLPVVFSTGYRIDYVASGSAIPVYPKTDSVHDGVAVAYKNTHAYWKFSKPDGVVTNFISPDFDPKGVKYQQLTPDGPLAP